jgi:glycosyltransferase EpsE
LLEVSVILTTYNRSGQLSGTIESILNQSFSNFELIICDDCSSDDTQKICEKYAVQDSRVRYIRNEHNLKMPENLNNGIRAAQGIYIANLHDGDIYRCDLIEKWKTTLDVNKEAAFVFNDYKENTSTFGSSSYSISPNKNREGQFEIALHFFKTLTSCVWGTVMVRKSVYDEMGLFNSEFGFISDVEMWLRITKKYKFAYIPEMLIELTPREENHPYRYYNWKHKFWEFIILKKAQEYFEKILPIEVHKSKKLYKLRLTYNFLKTLISLVKNKQFERVKEGLSIFKDSPFIMLRIVGKLFNQNHYPDWYNKKYYWQSLYN